MQTIQLQLEDSLYDDIVKNGINIQDEIKATLYKLVYKKEHQIASDINIAIKEVQDNKSRPISELFSGL